MEIKLLQENDFYESMKLSMYAFQYRIPETDVESRKMKLKKHQILGIWDEETLAAKLHILPLRVLIGQKAWKMGGVAGVATYPEFRRKGYVKELLKAALIHMKESGQIVSLLHPFDIAFYRNFGWEIFSEYKKAIVAKEYLHRITPVKGKIKRFSKETHHPDIEDVYKLFSSRFNGMLVRDHEWWMEAVYDDAQIAVYYNEDGEPQGYILYTVKNKLMDVQEMTSLCQEARVGLWNFICQHDSMVEKVQFLLSPHEPFPYFIQTPKVQMEIFPYFMARLVDVEQCLKEFVFKKTGKSVFLHLEDSYADWNNGTYLINQEGVSVYKEKEGAACAHLPRRGLSLSINDLSAIIFGYKRPLELMDMGYLSGPIEEVEAFEEMIPSMKSFFYDFF